MKVAIREQIDIEDEQRVKLADILDSKETKRQATRDEIKDFAWALGSEWAEALEARWQQLFGAGDETAEEEVVDSDQEPNPDDLVAEEDDEDLLGLGDMSAEEAMEALL